jgi:hypothetical protein
MFHAAAYIYVTKLQGIAFYQVILSDVGVSCCHDVPSYDTHAQGRSEVVIAQHITL